MASATRPKRRLHLLAHDRAIGKGQDPTSLHQIAGRASQKDQFTSTRALRCDAPNSINGQASKLAIVRETYWTDSMIVLAWIKGTSERWKTFVASHITEIQFLSRGEWNHVTSAENPADILSRDVSATDLQTDLVDRSFLVISNARHLVNHSTVSRKNTRKASCGRRGRVRTRGH